MWLILLESGGGGGGVENKFWFNYYALQGDKTLDGYQKKKYVCKLLFIFLLGNLNFSQLFKKDFFGCFFLVVYSRKDDSGFKSKYCLIILYSNFIF